MPSGELATQAVCRGIFPDQLDGHGQPHRVEVVLHEEVDVVLHLVFPQLVDAAGGLKASPVGAFEVKGCSIAAVSRRDPDARVRRVHAERRAEGLRGVGRPLHRRHHESDLLAHILALRSKKPKSPTT